MSAHAKRQWTPAEDRYIAQAVRDGVMQKAIARHVGVSHATIAARIKHLGLRSVPVDDRPRVARDACGYCATRADAPIEFGCAKCRPLRREIAA